MDRPYPLFKKACAWRGLQTCTRPEVAPSTLKPSSTRRRRKRKAHLPLLSRESRDAVADDDVVRKMEGDPEEHLNACNVARQASTSDIYKLGANAGFAAVRNLYDQQDKVMKVLAYRVVDGGLQRARAQKSFGDEKGGQVQYLVEWADSVLLKEHLQILEDNNTVHQALANFQTLDLVLLGSWWRSLGIQLGSLRVPLRACTTPGIGGRT